VITFYESLQKEGQELWSSVAQRRERLKAQGTGHKAKITKENLFFAVWPGLSCGCLNPELLPGRDSFLGEIGNGPINSFL
jgi:hypothetical protein